MPGRLVRNIQHVSGQYGKVDRQILRQHGSWSCRIESRSSRFKGYPAFGFRTGLQRLQSSLHIRSGQTYIRRYCPIVAEAELCCAHGGGGAHIPFPLPLPFFPFSTIFFAFPLADCGSNISSLNYGIIASPNFPNKYDGPAKNHASKTCNWFIRVGQNQRVSLYFELFSVEGDQAGRDRAA